MEAIHVQHTYDNTTHPIEIDDSDFADDTVEHDTTQPSGTLKSKKTRSKPSTDRIPGQTLLPVSKVEAIVHADGASLNISKEAMFTLSIATEEFIKRLAQSAHGRSELDRRSMVQYRDIASTAYHFEEFQFLQDMIPIPMPLHQAMSMREAILRGEVVSEDAPVPTQSPTTTQTASTSKGKGKAKASNGRSSDKPIVHRERVRDSKGRWSLSGMSERDTLEDDEDIMVMDGEIPRDMTSSEGRSEWLAQAEGKKPDDAVRVSPPSPPPRSQEHATKSRTSTGSQRLANNGNSLGGGVPLWTRIPLPRPPSTPITTSHVNTQLNETERNSNEKSPVPSSSPTQKLAPLPHHQSSNASPRSSRKSHPPPLQVTVKRPALQDPMPMDIDPIQDSYSTVTTAQHAGRTIYSAKT